MRSNINLFIHNNGAAEYNNGAGPIVLQIYRDISVGCPNPARQRTEIEPLNRNQTGLIIHLRYQGDRRRMSQCDRDAPTYSVFIFSGPA
jgi:hypothetical protein